MEECERDCQTSTHWQNSVILVYYHGMGFTNIYLQNAHAELMSADPQISGRTYGNKQRTLLTCTEGQRRYHFTIETEDWCARATFVCLPDWARGAQT